MPRNIQDEIETLYASLNSELDRFGRDEQFYSVRDIMHRYHASRRTVEKVLARLEEEKQVIVEPGCGIFVSGNRNKNVYVVASVHHDWPAEYWRDLDAALEEEIQKYPEMKFTRAFFEPNDTGSYLSYLKALNVDAILLTFPIQRYSKNDIAAMLELPIPVVFMENNLLCDGINAIDSQPEYSGMMAAECLIRNGHTKLALILSEPWSIGDRRRNDGFLNYARLHGIEPLVIDCEIRGGEAACNKAYEKMLAYLRANGPGFTGCFTMSDYSALGIISALKEFGLRVPEDVSIIGDAGIASGAHFDPPLTTIAHDIRGTARIIGEGLQQLFNGGSFGIRVLPSYLLERQSVRKNR